MSHFHVFHPSHLRRPVPQRPHGHVPAARPETKPHAVDAARLHTRRRETLELLVAGPAAAAGPALPQAAQAPGQGQQREVPGGADAAGALWNYL